VIKTKTLKMRIIYVVAAVAMLAMLIPAMALPVSAQGNPYLQMNLVDPIDPEAVGATTMADGAPGAQGMTYAYNVDNSIVEVKALDLPQGVTVTGWILNNITPPTATFVPNTDPGTANPIRVQAAGGETQIEATLSNGSTIAVDKKWGTIDTTAITPAQNIPVTWNESVKEFQASASVTDTVTGTFTTGSHAVQGVILNWYLVGGWENVAPATGEAQDLINNVKDLDPAYFTSFDNNWGKSSNVTTMQTVTGVNGSSTVSLFANGEENVNVVVIPEYPFDPQKVVTSEVTTVNFWTYEMEVVPQVRWAGEKIVLEKNFFSGPLPEDANGLFFVRFSCTGNSNGLLAPINDVGYGTSNGQTQDVLVDENGFASVILYSPVAGDVNVTASLYFVEPTSPFTVYLTDYNQHHFVVYFLKLGNLTLGNVYGKRMSHDSGLWIPNNPWDPMGLENNPATPDVVTDELNVSQDTLLRARVTGTIKDDDGNSYTLPADWPDLASPNWKLTNVHWDIMNNPGDFNPAVGTAPSAAPVTAANIEGDYEQPYPTGPVVAEHDVIGPFSPGIEQPTPTGYQVPNLRLDSERDIQTVVPNGVLDWWDAPMPPAKITFMITNPDAMVTTDNAGFFKEAEKDCIYYGWYFDPTLTNPPPVMVFTNPFYLINVPAHWAIPAFDNNGGYDWDTFGNSSSHNAYGPYEFWWFLNRETGTPLVPTTDAANHPTLAQVYSDNHGEAMVYLNGYWNMDLATNADPNVTGTTNKTSGGAIDIKPGTIVGTSTVQAMADYPYFRQSNISYKAITSNTVLKTWQWGKTVWGADPTTFPDGQVDPGFAAGDEANSKRMVCEVGTLNLQQYLADGVTPNPAYLKSSTGEKMAFLWVTDEDGKPPVGETIDWDVQSATTIRISDKTGTGVSNYNDVMEIIGTVNGFLAGTNGTKDATKTMGSSTMIGITADSRMVSAASIDPSTGIASSPFDAISQNNALATLFYKFFNKDRSADGPQPSDYAVAAVILTSSLQEDANLHATLNEYYLNINNVSTLGQISREWNLNWGMVDAPDDPLLLGDANYDGKVNMADVILAERMMLGLNPVMEGADINRDGKVNIADILAMEREMLGY